MTAGRRSFHSVAVETNELNEHRRRVPLAAPRVVLRTTTRAGQMQSIELTRDELGRLVMQAAEACVQIGKHDEQRLSGAE